MKFFKIYCAGFDVFHSKAKEIAEYQHSTCTNLGFEVLTPIDNEISNSQEIFEKNLEMIKNCDFMVANLNNFRGKDMDSGTAFEIGYAYSLNKPIFGYMDDTRNLIEKNNDKVVTIIGNEIYKIEDFDLPVNLMIGKSCKEIIKGSFVECLVNCVLPYTKTNKKQEVQDFSYVKMFSCEKAVIKNNPIYSTLYPDLYEEIIVHDKTSDRIWCKLSDKAFKQYQRFIKTHSFAQGIDNQCK
jgi:nucleoside 2-deoxyribosyltransferase